MVSFRRCHLEREATGKHQCSLVPVLGLILAVMVQLAPAQADCIDQCAGEAQSTAMSACTAEHGSGCEIEAWTCSHR
jgi:hypothetical protein